MNATPSKRAKSTSRYNYGVGFVTVGIMAAVDRLFGPAITTLVMATGIAIVPIALYRKHPEERFSTLAWLGVFLHLCLGVVVLLPSSPPEVNSPFLVPVVVVGVLAWVALLVWSYRASQRRPVVEEPSR